MTRSRHLWLARPGRDGAADAGLWLLALVTTAIVVQADHPSDDRAFWRTRPIAPGLLAAAKITMLAILLVVVPVAINTLRLILYGAPLGPIGTAAVQIAVLAGFAVVPAWPLALATRTVPRFLALALVAAVMARRPTLVLVGPRQAGRLRTTLASSEVPIRVVH